MLPVRQADILSAGTRSPECKLRWPHRLQFCVPARVIRGYIAAFRSGAVQEIALRPRFAEPDAPDGQ